MHSSSLKFFFLAFLAILLASFTYRKSGILIFDFINIFKGYKPLSKPVHQIHRPQQITHNQTCSYHPPTNAPSDQFSTPSSSHCNHPLVRHVWKHWVQCFGWIAWIVPLECLHRYLIRKTHNVTWAAFPQDRIFHARGRSGHCLNNRLYAIENAVTPRGKVEMSSTFPWRNMLQANQIA